MIRYQCDKCGELFEKGSEISELSLEPRIAQDARMEWFLCPECRIVFTIWIKEFMKGSK